MLMILSRLCDLRQDRDLTQADIARLLHTTQPQYSLYESGDRELPLRHLMELADFFDVSTDYLLGRTNDPRPIRRIVGK